MCVFFTAAEGKGRRSSVGRRHGARAKKKHHPGCFFFGSGPGERQGKEKPRCAPARGQSKTKKPGCFFFFLLRPWAPARGQSKKKNTTQGVFFLLRPRGKAGEGEASLGAGTGPEQKKKHHPGCFFCAPAPGKGRGRRSYVGRRHGARAKKKHHPGCFFCSGLAPLRPRANAHSLTAGLGGASPSPGWCFFFCCGPARTGWCFFFCCGPAQTLTHSLWAGAISARPDGVFFFCCGPAGSFLVSLKRPGGAAAKKKTPRGGVFFCCGPARTLTHSLRAWVVPSPRRGGVFFFAAAPPGRGGVFFFAVAPPRRSLTHCGLGRFRQGRMVFFFCCGPAGSFLVSLKRPGGATAKKKKHHGAVFFFCCGPARTLTHSLRAWVVPSPRRGGVFFLLRPRPDRGGVFFFAVAPPRRSLTHCGLGRFRQGSGGVFFFLRPRPVFFG